MHALLKHERGFADATFVNREHSLKPFLAWLVAQDVSLATVSPEEYWVAFLSRGCESRRALDQLEDVLERHGPAFGCSNWRQQKMYMFRHDDGSVEVRRAVITSEAVVKHQ
jgi:hypothetical protein